MSRRHLLMLSTLLALLASGCGSGREGPLEVGVIGKRMPSLRDRPVSDHDASSLVRSSMAQGLVRLDGSGEIEPGLAERWAISDDGLSYLFRLAKVEWPDGKPVLARDVARRLNEAIKPRRGEGTVDATGAIRRVTPMTDRVIEIELVAARPNLLTLLAQPQFAILSQDGKGSGPFVRSERDRDPDRPRQLRLERINPGFDGEPDTKERVDLHIMSAAEALAAFRADHLDAVFGGTIDDLPLARVSELGDRLRFDPAIGLFGLVPGRKDGPAADPEVRALLNEALDREALLALFDIPGLQPRFTVLQPGLDEVGTTESPAWAGQSHSQRIAALRMRARQLFGSEPPSLTIDVPRGPGGRMIFARIAADWRLLGVTVDRAAPGRSADFRLVDEVAPSRSGAWFLRHFRCGSSPLCDPEVDDLLDSARSALAPQQRALFLDQAARRVDNLHLFLPIAAPVRWSAVASRAVGFQPNPFAIHPLASLDEAPRRAN